MVDVQIRGTTATSRKPGSSVSELMCRLVVVHRFGRVYFSACSGARTSLVSLSGLRLTAIVFDVTDPAAPCHSFAKRGGGSA